MGPDRIDVPADQTDLAESSVSRAEAVARRLGEMIVAQSMPAGHRLGTKEDLRQQFGVAVGTVNEAVRLLETRGLVRTRPGPHGGIFVDDPTPQMRLSHLVLGLRTGPVSVEDCLNVRNALEPLVAVSVATSATDVEIGELREIVARMGEHLSDAPGYLEWNWRLHQRMAELSGNPLLSGIYLALLDYLRESVQGVAPDEEFAKTSRKNLALHEALVEALASRDLARASRAAQRHTPLAEAVVHNEPSAAAGRRGRPKR